MPLTFDDDECYRLLLAMELYSARLVGTEDSLLGSWPGHMKKCEAVYLRLRKWHNAHRAEDGHPPCYPDAGC